MGFVKRMFTPSGTEDRQEQMRLEQYALQQQQQAAAEQAARDQAAREAAQAASAQAVVAPVVTANEESWNAPKITPPENAINYGVQEAESLGIIGDGGYGVNQVGRMGVPDTWGLLDSYNNALKRAESTLAPGELYSSKVDPAAIWEKTRGDVLNRERTNLLRDYRNQFSQGYESSSNYFDDTADDKVVNNILSEQQSEAQNAIDRAKARGVLGDAGINYANKQLGNSATRARSALDAAGQGVLGRYRQGLTSISNPVADRVNTWNFGDNLDLGAVRSQVDNKANQYRNLMEGDIRNVVGDTKYFDTDLLLGRAGTQEPASNLPGTAILGDAFNADPKKKKDPKLGVLGNVGAI